MSTARRALSYGLVAFGLIGYGWIATRIHHTGRDPLPARVGSLIGPTGKSLRQAADREVQSGRDILNDISVAPGERFSSYRLSLETAERLLERSLRAQPAQAQALSQLAAVRWELSPPTTEESEREHLETIALAARMAPSVPKVQRQLGELLLKMGHRDEAVTYLRRAVALDPLTGKSAVILLREHQFSAREILDSLPSRPTVLCSLHRPFIEDGEEALYVEVLEQAFADRTTISPEMLLAYGNATQTRPQRLLDRMQALHKLQDQATEATRLGQRARAHLLLDQATDAIRDARAAVDADPEEVRHRELLAHVFRETGDPDLAVATYRSALGLPAARAAGATGAKKRATLYREIGNTEEAAGRADRAYDAYRMALSNDPTEAHSARRLEELERAAGSAETRE